MGCLRYVIVVFPVHTIIFDTLINLALSRENLSLGEGGGVANNKGTDQPAHPRNLISAFVIPLLENIISRLATSEI